MLHLLTDTLRNSVLITGIVIIMMMMIESFNIESHGRLFSKVKGSSLRQVILASVLGSIPGCIGGFATVSLYSRRLLSFGALTAMMIASSGDEAFVMLAMMPDRALWTCLASSTHSPPPSRPHTASTARSYPLISPSIRPTRPGAVTASPGKSAVTL